MIRERTRLTSEGADDPTLPFLDLIICPDYEVSHKKDELQKYGLNHRKYSFGGFNPTVNKSTRFDLRKVVSKRTEIYTSIYLNIVFFNTENRH